MRNLSVVDLDIVSVIRGSILTFVLVFGVILLLLLLLLLNLLLLLLLLLLLHTC